jgi:predicted metal-dependent HD superfamily phosphohydrolase
MDLNKDVLSYLTDTLMPTNDRMYHNIYHITNMFVTAKIYGIKLTSEEIWAIWFHDVVYIPDHTKNEELSGDMAIYYASRYSDLNMEKIMLIKDLIMTTKTHYPVMGLPTHIIDLDLATLGLSWESYMENNAKIRSEYNHLSDDQWKKGRTKFIKSFLNRTCIYQNTKIYDDLEDQARHNLKKELMVLQLDKI